MALAIGALEIGVLSRGQGDGRRCANLEVVVLIHVRVRQELVEQLIARVAGAPAMATRPAVVPRW
jgi:hypothetical protein